MKTFSKVALAAALATATGGLTLAPPASAKDKPAPAGPKYSPDVVKAAQIAQPALAAKNYAAAEPAIAQIDAAAKTDDDRYIASILRFQLEQQKVSDQLAANPNAKVNDTAEAAPLDALLTNPKTPRDMIGKFAFRRGALSYNAKQYPLAIKYFEQAQAAGFNENDIGMLLVRARVESGDTASGLAALDAAIAKETAAGRKAPEDYYRYGIARANASKNQALTFEWLKKYVSAYPNPKNWRDVIVIYGLQDRGSIVQLDNAQKLDLYRLLRSAKALADQADYAEYAQKALDKGLPAESQTVLKEGAATGRLPSSSGYAATLASSVSQALRNEGSLAPLEKKAAASADGKLAAQTAEAYLGADNNAKAIELYRLALQKGGVNADEVNTRLGIALARSGDKAGAKAAFALVTGAPRTGIANLWVSWMDSPSA